MTDAIRTEAQFFAAQVATGGLALIYLTSGIKIQGTLIWADEHCIYVESSAGPKSASNCLIMKSAIASVVVLVAHGQSIRGDSHDLRGVLHGNRI